MFAVVNCHAAYVGHDVSGQGFSQARCSSGAAFPTCCDNVVAVEEAASGCVGEPSCLLQSPRRRLSPSLLHSPGLRSQFQSIISWVLNTIVLVGLNNKKNLCCHCGPAPSWWLLTAFLLCSAADVQVQPQYISDEARSRFGLRGETTQCNQRCQSVHVLLVRVACDLVATPLAASLQCARRLIRGVLHPHCLDCLSSTGTRPQPNPTVDMSHLDCRGVNAQRCDSKRTGPETATARWTTDRTHPFRGSAVGRQSGQPAQWRASANTAPQRRTHSNADQQPARPPLCPSVMSGGRAHQ